jgi:paraquat-inducible protein B
VFVNAPYDKYVTTETRFWSVSGVEISLNADGLRVRTESVAALLAGGIAFDVPEFARAGATPLSPTPNSRSTATAGSR